MERISNNKLIKIVVNPPNESELRKAKEILEFRKYRAQYTSNIVIAIFTVIMALSTAIQAIYLFF